MAKTIDLVMGLKDGVSPKLGSINKNLQTTSGKLNAVGKSVTKLGSIMKGAFIGGAIASYATQAMKAYDTQIQAEKSVSRAIQATGKTAEMAKAELNEWKTFASKQQDITAFGDEETLKNISGLISQGFGKKDIKDIVAMSQDIARSTGTSQDDITKAMATYVKTGKGAKALTSTYKLNADLIGKGKTESERLAEVWKAFDKSAHKGASTEYLKTFEGQLESLQGRLSDLNEPIGQLFSSLLGYDTEGATAISTLDKAVKDLTDDIQGMADRSKELDGGITGVGRACFEAHPLITTLLVSLAGGKTLTSLNSVIQAVRGIAGAIGALNIAVNGLLGPIGLATTALMGLIALGENYKNLAPELKKSLEDTQRESLGIYNNPHGPDMSNLDWGDSKWGAKNGEASGTAYFEGGRTLVGEYGPELVDLPRGASVKTAQQTQRELSGGGYTINCPVTIQGNVIGNEDYVNAIGDSIVSRVKLAMGNM